jgi:hypothetical protein
MRPALPAEQCAWVLRAARAGAPVPRHRTAAGLAAAVGVHRAQVLRWERGDVRLTSWHAEAYEAACGLEPGSITAAFENIHRDHDPWGAGSVIRDRDGSATGYAIGDLVERLLAPEPTRGAQWWELAGALTPDTADVLRRRDWEELFDRMLRENEFAFGVPYTMRLAALARLVAHRRAGEVFVDLARESLRGDDRHVYTDLATGLLFTPGDEAGAVLTDLVVRPAGEPALWSALFATTGRLRAGSTEPLPDGLLGAAVHHVLDRSQTYRVRRTAASLVRLMDPRAAQGLAARAVVTEAHRGVAEVLRFGQVLGRRDARGYVGRLTAAVRAGGAQVDETLHDLLTRAVRDADVILRDGALLLLTCVEALRRPIAAVTAEVLAESVAARSALAQECIPVLLWAAGPETVEPILRIGLDARLAVEVRVRVLQAATTGLTPGHEAAERQARAALDRIYATERADRRLASAAVYLLGARGLMDPLREVREIAVRDDAKAWVEACDSWLSIPRWHFPADGGPAAA